MAYVPHSISGAISLAEIDITAQLAQRPARPPDYAAENRALVHVAHAMATRPASILQTLVDTALALCQAGSAGISLLETHDGAAIFRWVALAGAYVVHRDGTMPRDASPCGITIARNAPQLLATPGRVFPAVYGAVTTGVLWRFLRLQDTTVAVDSAEYVIEQVQQIVGILVGMVKAVAGWTADTRTE